MKTHLRRLLMCCLLLLILPMAAFAEENELPVEWVRYGYGLPNPASVDAHGLTEEAITLEGVAYAPKLENGRVYVRLEDLAAAKLVRENGDALQALGLAVSDLQIENGQLKAPGKGGSPRPVPQHRRCRGLAERFLYAGKRRGRKAHHPHCGLCGEGQH